MGISPRLAIPPQLSLLMPKTAIGAVPVAHLKGRVFWQEMRRIILLKLIRRSLKGLL